MRASLGTSSSNPTETKRLSEAPPEPSEGNRVSSHSSTGSAGNATQDRRTRVIQRRRDPHCAPWQGFREGRRKRLFVVAAAAAFVADAAAVLFRPARRAPPLRETAQTGSTERGTKWS